MSNAVFDFKIASNDLSKSQISGMRVALGLSALVAIILGILILVWPGASVAVVAILFGLYFLIIGLVRIAKGIFSHGLTAGLRVLNILLGVLLLIAGILVFRSPEIAIVALGLLIGIAWIIEGIAALIETTSDSSRWFGTLFGVVSVIAGIVVLFLPLQSVVLLVWVGGIFLIVGGIVQLVQAFTFGRTARS